MSRPSGRVPRRWLLRSETSDDDDVDETAKPVDLNLPGNAEDELLFRLFSLLAEGGPFAQPDLEVRPYLAATKALYRDVARVYRRREGDAVMIANDA